MSLPLGLDRAAEELKTELDRYGIQVPPGRHMILFEGMAIEVNPGTSRKECLRRLRKMIKAAKKLEFERTQLPLL